jgi:hypothetical protein
MLVHEHTGMMQMRMIIITQSARVGNANDYHYAICPRCHVALHHCGTSASLVLGRLGYVSKYLLASMLVSAYIQVSEYPLRHIAPLFILPAPLFMIPPNGRRWPHARPTVCIIPICFYFFVMYQWGIKRKWWNDNLPYKSMSYVGIKRWSSNRDMVSLYTVYFLSLVIKWLQALCQGIQGIQGLFTPLLYSFLEF